jgi:predicted enzyme related to lactoylglutathione lyase
MKITEIAFSAYAVTDIPRAKAFYEGVLGLKPAMEHDTGAGGHWIEYDIAGGTLGIGQAEGWMPSPNGCTVALEVENFDEAVASLKKAGTPIKMGPFETPVCHMIMVSDPDENTLIIHKRKPGNV